MKTREHNTTQDFDAPFLIATGEVMEGEFPPKAKALVKEFIMKYQKEFTLVNISKLTEEQIAELAFTQEEREQLKRARMMPITYDVDCPPVTPERARNFRRASSLHTAN